MVVLDEYHRFRFAEKALIDRTWLVIHILAFDKGT